MKNLVVASEKKSDFLEGSGMTSHSGMGGGSGLTVVVPLEGQHQGGSIDTN
jgi:DNA primase